MQQQMINTYADLMTALDELPDSISLVQEHITALKLSAAEHERTLAQREAILIQQAEGKNAELRKAALEQLKTGDAIYRNELRHLLANQEELAQEQDALDKLTRQYGAVCYQTRLHAALLAYLGSAGAPVRHEEAQFMAHKPANGDNLHVRVTAADAAELGL
jgi:hypothetical protein